MAPLLFGGLYMFNAKCDEIRPILKEIDSDFDISFNVYHETYLITHKDFPFMTVPYGEFTRETIENIRKAVYINVNGDVIEEVEDNNKKIEESKDREYNNMIECMAKDIRKPLINAIDYGR